VTDVTPEALYGSPNALALHYRRFRVADRLLLTGHSHQAWPDVGFEAQQRAWLDAAEYVDEKWERAFAMADRVRRGFAGLLDDPTARSLWARTPTSWSCGGSPPCPSADDPASSRRPESFTPSAASSTAWPRKESPS